VIGKYIVKINLSHARKRRELEIDVIKAVLFCVIAYADVLTRKRPSQIRKQLFRVSREAIATEKHLEYLRSALTDLLPPYRELLNSQLESVAKIAVSLVAKQVPWFHALSPVAQAANDMARRLRGMEKGGAPKMLEFRILVLGLIPAFERATGRAARVTWHEHRSRFEGRFFTLVEDVLPLARKFERQDRPMRIPKSQNARGKYIHKLTVTRRSRKRNT
jgi:hypothetical protein